MSAGLNEPGSKAAYILFVFFTKQIQNIYYCHNDYSVSALFVQIFIYTDLCSRMNAITAWHYQAY